MRVVRKFKLAIVLGAVALSFGVFSSGASAAPSFTWTTSTSTTQAAAPTDVTFTFASSSPERLTDLRVEFPVGMKLDPSFTPPACTTPIFEADRCAANTRVGTVSMQLTTLGLNMTVPGTVYKLDDPADSAPFLYGVVLRPPLSALGLIDKFHIRFRGSYDTRSGINGTNANQMPNRISMNRVSVPTRVSRFTMRLDGMNATSNLLYNPTSCPPNRPFRARATFSDGSTLDRVSPFTTTGCDRVPLTSSADFTLDDPTPAQRTSFAILLTGGRDAERGELHDSDIQFLEADLASVGTFDTEMLAAMPGCPADLQMLLRCPEGSRVAEFKVWLRSLRAPLNGKLYRSAESSTSLVGVFELPDARVVGIKIEISAVNQADSKTLKMSIPVELPIESAVVKVETPILKLHGKPASCTNREARMTIGGYSAGQRTWKPVLAPPEPCPPIARFVSPGDADADGDGFADESLKPQDFQVKYDVADGGNGVNRESARCDLESPDPARADKGKIIIINDGSGGIACDVTGASGDVTVVFSIASIDGHVTVLKSSYNIDSEPPVVSSIAPDPIGSSTTNVELPFEFTDDRIAHPQSVYEIECTIEDSTGARHTTTPGHKYIDTIKLRGGGTCQWDTGRKGKFLASVAVKSSTNRQATVLTRTIIVDESGSVISPTDVRDQDSDGDGLLDDALRLPDFDIPFSVTDDYGVEADSVTCTLKLINPVAMDKGLRVVDTDGDGLGDVCRVSGAPIGEIAIDISAADWVGHVTVLKLSYWVDGDDPFTTGPEPPPSLTDDIDYEFEVTDSSTSHPQSEFTAECRAAGDKLEGGKEGLARVITDRDSGRSKGFCRVEDLPDGSYELTIRVRDKVGHVTLIKRTANVDALPPTISLVDVRDQDDDGDGFADDPLRSADFIVPFTLEDEPKSDDPDIQCSVAQTNPAYQDNKNEGQMPGRDDVLFCPVRPPNSGPVELTITATSLGGHVTVLKISFMVDAEGPAIRITRAQDDDADGDGVADDPMRSASFDVPVEISDANGVARAKCTVRGWNPEKKEPIIGVDDDGDGLIDRCRVEDAPSGPIVVEITAEDVVGNPASTSRGFVVDRDPPVITLLGDLDADGDGVFDKHFLPSNFKGPFRVIDASDLDAASINCQVRDYNWRVTVADVDRDGIGDVCEVSEMTPGAFELEISAADVHGHVTVLKVAGVVEEPMAQVELLAPTAGQTYSYGGTLYPDFSIAGLGPYTFVCLLDSMIVASPCTQRMPINLTGVSSGSHTFSVTARDGTGRSTTDSAVFQIGAPPPSDVCVTVYPPPAGCPGGPPVVCTPGSTLPGCPGGGTSLTCPLLPSSVPGCPNRTIACVAIYPPPAGCPGGPPLYVCPPPAHINPPPGCGVTGTIPGGGTTITLP